MLMVAVAVDPARPVYCAHCYVCYLVCWTAPVSAAIAVDPGHSTAPAGVDLIVGKQKSDLHRLYDHYCPVWRCPVRLSERPEIAGHLVGAVVVVGSTWAQHWQSKTRRPQPAPVCIVAFVNGARSFQTGDGDE